MKKWKYVREPNVRSKISGYDCIRDEGEKLIAFFYYTFGSNVINEDHSKQLIKIVNNHNISNG